MSPSVVILAGRRAGGADAIAQGAGVSHKCIAPVAGVPMILRVLRTVTAALPDARVLISIDDASVVDALPEVADGIAQGRIAIVAASANIVDSIAAAVRAAPLPMIVTTADNVLLTSDALHRIAAFGPFVGADAVVALARQESVMAAHPDGQRRFYPFRGGAYSNCNLYWLGSASAMAAAEAFREGGQFAKYPARIVAAFGVVNLLRFRLQLNGIEGMCAHIGRRFKVAFRPLILEDGRQSIDVDNERTLRVAEELLARDAASGA